MASRKQAVKISTPSIEELQALFDLGSEPRLPADEFGTPVDRFNTIVMGLKILMDTADAGSQSASDFLDKLAGARGDEPTADLFNQLIKRADSFYEAAIKNSVEAKRELHTMAEQLIQGFSSFSAEYPRYVAANWK